MAGKKNKSIGFLISELMEEYNIPTKKDFERLSQRIDELENLLKQVTLTSSYRVGKVSSLPRKGKKITAAEMVFDIVRNQKKPVNFKFLKEKTGFEDKKLRNIIFRLNSTGQIRRVERGAYLPVESKEE
ncbi:MAG: hypothetical protein RBR53_09895 [Desulforegulaceae bacterium]|nr:hypothetical protein [Desulforegulaceae bacterium]